MSQSPYHAVRVIDSATEGVEIPLVEGQGNAQVVLWPGNGAKYRSFHLFSLDKSDRTVELSHESDCVYYVMHGSGTVLDLATDDRQPLGEGTMIHIDAADRYRIEAGEDGIKFLGGPCPPDEKLYADLKTAGSAIK